MFTRGNVKETCVGRDYRVLELRAIPKGRATIQLQQSGPHGNAGPVLPRKPEIWISCELSRCLNVKPKCL